MGVEPKIIKIGVITPKWMVDMENPIKNGMILGGKPPIFGGPPIYPT